MHDLPFLAFYHAATQPPTQLLRDNKEIYNVPEKTRTERWTYSKPKLVTMSILRVVP